MKPIVTMCVFAVISACAGNETHEGTALADGRTVYTLRCSDGWPQCHNDATKICGKSGYTEMDRFEAGGISTAGRFEDRQNSASEGTGSYSENARKVAYDRGLSILCN